MLSLKPPARSRILIFLAGSFFIAFLLDLQSLKAQFIEKNKPASVKNRLGYPPDSIQVESLITSVAVNYLGISIQQERKVSSLISFSYGLGLHYSFYNARAENFGTRFLLIKDRYFGYEYTVSSFTPYLYGELRRYVDLGKRRASNKNIQLNSGSYACAFFEIPLSAGRLTQTPNLVLAYPVGVRIGTRRALGKHLYLDLSMGAALKLNFANHPLQPKLRGNLMLAYAL